MDTQEESQFYDYHLDLLQKQLDQRKKHNPMYSFRAYSRDLKIDPSSLRKILKKQRPFPLSACERVTQNLKLSHTEYTRFISSVSSQKNIGNTPGLNRPSAFELDTKIDKKIITEWEHYAILNLFFIKNFIFDDHWIGNRLGISNCRASEVMENLVKSGLIHIQNCRWKRTKRRLKTSDLISSKELKQSHLQELELAKKVILDSPLLDFDSFSMVYPTNPDHLSQARKLIRDFFSKMESILEQETKTEVYQMSLQLYPLTKKQEDN